MTTALRPLSLPEPRLTKYIPWRPSPKQRLFLLLPNEEILFGGAAGPGKSVGLLMAALQYVDIPGYNALLLRRTFADLAKPDALIPLSREWLGPTDAVWNDQQHQWLFPSGATLSFGYLDTENDKYHYQGAAYQYVGFDELTQFSETQYTYVAFSRGRRRIDSKIPIRVRAASNPGGVGHEWVKKRFLIDGPANERIFIPAKLQDNPYIDRETYTRSLANLDYVTRAQLLDGDWEIEATSLFKRSWWKRYSMLPPPETLLNGGIFVDTAHEEKTTADYSVIATVRTTENAFYWTRLVRQRMEFPELERAVLDARAADPDLPVYIEETPGSKPLLQRLDRIAVGIVAWKIEGRSKMARAQAVSPLVEAGNCYLPEDASWAGDFVDEHAAFPTSAHDDMVDTTSMALLRLWQARGSTADLIREFEGVREDGILSARELDRRADAQRSDSIYERVF